MSISRVSMLEFESEKMLRIVRPITNGLGKQISLQQSLW